MEEQKNAVITVKAREKMVQARAGDQQLPKILKMAFGEGGVDESGQVVAPTADQTELKQEIMRKEIDGHSYPVATTCRYICSLTREECAGHNISELALVDAEGDVVAIKTFSSKGKDDDIEMTFTVDDVF